jgi:hypothetical protein
VGADAQGWSAKIKRGIGVRIALVAMMTACVVLLGGCASMRNEIISGFCGARPDDNPRWARIDAPADSEIYRRLVRADVLARPPDDGEEYWFALTTGEVKYCLTPLRRAYTVPERNGSDCDDRVGMWWVFHQTPLGPVTNGADERVCVN